MITLGMVLFCLGVFAGISGAICMFLAVSCSQFVQAFGVGMLGIIVMYAGISFCEIGGMGIAPSAALEVTEGAE